jgi:hypothetical protein
MKTVSLFKAQKTTKRFNLNQKVWIVHHNGNSMVVFFKWRGKGRYVNGIVDSKSPCVGELKEIEVSKSFYDRIMGNDKKELQI